MSDTEPLDLDAIEVRHWHWVGGRQSTSNVQNLLDRADGSAADVPALIAEVRRLRDRTELEHRLVTAVSAALWNVSNYPRKAQVHMLGQDTAPLSTKVAGAVIEQLDEHFGKGDA